VKSKVQVLGLRSSRQPHRPWSGREDARLRAIFPDRSTAAVAKILGRTLSGAEGRARILGLRKSARYLASPEACRLRRGDNVGAAFRFPKGHVPANKGLRRPGYSVGRGRMQSTQFKKGRLNGRAAELYKPIGTVITDGGGYLIRKICETGRGRQRWEFEHVIIWKRAHGPVPAGHAVCFKDGDRKHIELENLELISRADLMRRNSIHRRRSPEMREAIYALIAVKAHITKKEKKNGQKQIERPAGSPVRDARAAQG
jgi:hypothetical protein